MNAIYRKAAIVFARMDSTRLPGKALMKIKGIPLLQYCIDALKDNNNFEVILATSNRKTDFKLIDFAKKNSINCFAGSLENVAKRVLDCIDYYNIDYFARVNGDSPFVRSELIKDGFHTLCAGSYDFVTNLIPRTFPYGISVEVFSSAIFRKNYPQFGSAYYQEHVTSYFYDNIERFNAYFTKYDGENLSDYKLVVDTLEDKIRIERLLDLLPTPNLAKLPEIIEYYKKIL